MCLAKGRGREGAGEGWGAVRWVKFCVRLKQPGPSVSASQVRVGGVPAAGVCRHHATQRSTVAGTSRSLPPHPSSPLLPILQLLGLRLFTTFSACNRIGNINIYTRCSSLSYFSYGDCGDCVYLWRLLVKREAAVVTAVLFVCDQEVPNYVVVGFLSWTRVLPRKRLSGLRLMRFALYICCQEG